MYKGHCFNHRSLVISTAYLIVRGYEIVADVGGTVTGISERTTRRVEFDLCGVCGECVCGECMLTDGECVGGGSGCVYVDGWGVCGCV